MFVVVTKSLSGVVEKVRALLADDADVRVTQSRVFQFATFACAEN